MMLASQCQRAWSNFYEVGGKDVATLGSVANTVANGANLIIPFVSVSLRGASRNDLCSTASFEAPQVVQRRIL